MTSISVAEIFIGITALCAVAGVIYSIWRNGRSQGDKFTEVKTELMNLKDELVDPDHGLQAIEGKVNAFQVHCAKVSTGLATQVKTNKDEIDILRRKGRKK